MVGVGDVVGATDEEIKTVLIDGDILTVDV